MTEEYRSPPDLTGAKLDFSGFHPLDHSVWACRGYPGGRWCHLEYRWAFQWKWEVRARTLCLVGLHTPRQFWRRNPRRTWTGCIACAKQLSEEQEG